MWKFVINKNDNNQFSFVLKAWNWEIILKSEMYNSKASCENGINSVQENSQKEERFEKKTSANWKYFFNLKASNWQIIWSSEMYESDQWRDNWIQSVMKNWSTTNIQDNS